MVALVSNAFHGGTFFAPSIRIGVKGFPWIIAFKHGKQNKRASLHVPYKNERTALGLKFWINMLIDSADLVPDIHELVNQDVYDKQCKKGYICLISFLPHIYDSSAEERNKYIETI